MPVKVIMELSPERSGDFTEVKSPRSRRAPTSPQTHTPEQELIPVIVKVT